MATDHDMMDIFGYHDYKFTMQRWAINHLVNVECWAIIAVHSNILSLICVA